MTQPAVKRAWITGRIEGLSNEEIVNNFKNGQDHLNKNGYYVEDVVNILVNPELGFHQNAKIDVMNMVKCEVLAVLPDWKQSHKAMSEIQIAQDLDMEIIYITNLQKFMYRFEKIAKKFIANNINEVGVLKTDYNYGNKE